MTMCSNDGARGGLGRLVLAATLTGTVAACSLVDLASELDVAECEPDPEVNPCADLAPETSEPCEAWQCNPDTRFCEWGLRDDDNDGFQDAECAREDDPVDCDDGDHERSPGLDETCDNKDNDCDDRLDEGALEPAPTSLVFFSSDNVTDLATAQDQETGSVRILYRYMDRAENRLGGTSLSGVESEEPDNASPLTLSCDFAVAQGLVGTSAECSSQAGVRQYLARSIAVTPFDTDQMAVAFNRQDGADRRVTAGLWTEDGLEVTEAIQARGLTCAPQEACAGDASESQPTTEAIALATTQAGKRVLVAYVRNPDEIEETCGEVADVDGEPARVHLHLLDERDLDDADGRNDRELVEVTETPLIVDNVRAGSGVSVVAVPMDALPDGAPSWLLGYQQASGTVVIAHVVAASDGLMLADPSLLEIDPPQPRNAELADLSMAFGEPEDGATQLGVAYVDGCGDDAVAMARVVVMEADGDSLTVASEGMAHRLGGAERQSGPSIAYNVGRGAWGVSYVSRDGLQARLLEKDGSLRGDGSYTLFANTSGGGRSSSVRQRPTTVGFLPEGASSWFSSVALVAESGAEASREVQSITLQCGR